MEMSRPERAVMLILIGVLVVGSALFFFKWFRGYPESGASAGNAPRTLPGMIEGRAEGQTGRAADDPEEENARGAVQGEPEKPGKVKIWVHVAGQVASPGVYQLERGARVQEAIAAAGGQTADGRADMLNLAAPVSDGEKIYVPSRADLRSGEAVGTAAWTAEYRPAGSETVSRVNPNTASLEALERIPGIGPSLARRIADYRKRHGPFQRLEDLKKVSGIGDRKFEEMKEFLVLP